MLLAKYLDSLRVIPRIIVFGYAWLMVDISTWFMSLPAPTGPQSTFISVMVGAAAAIFGFYVNSGKKE